KTRPEVARALAHAAAHADDETRMFAALALGDDDSLIPLVRSELAYWRSNDHGIAADRASNLVEALRGVTHIAELRNDLLACVESFKKGDTETLAEIANQLHRSGHRGVPEVVVREAARSKREEKQHSRRTGIPAFDQRFKPNDSPTLARAARLFI